MARKISKDAMDELLVALKGRYERSSKKDKGRILDEFVAVSGYHRKHAIRLLGSWESPREPSRAGAVSALGCHRRIYDEAVTEALTVLWEAADRICGKRLRAIIPELIVALERHGHLKLDDQVRERVLSISAATIDRLLAPVRSQARPWKKSASPRSRVVPSRYGLLPTGEPPPLPGDRLRGPLWWQHGRLVHTRWWPRTSAQGDRVHPSAGPGAVSRCGGARSCSSRFLPVRALTRTTMELSSTRHCWSSVRRGNWSSRDRAPTGRMIRRVEQKNGAVVRRLVDTRGLGVVAGRRWPICTRHPASM